jgi:murein DD-endopeptidase MepM/ murein hydrolase activator NlpD
MMIPILKENRTLFHPVLPFEPGSNHLFPFDFTEKNIELSSELIADTDSFATYIRTKLRENNCRYGIGGYDEHRSLYARSRHFDVNIGSPLKEYSTEINPKTEPRRLHLGTDIWGPAGTAIYSPLDGIVHSFAFNNHFGDYGATIILTHHLNGKGFHTLYGHLSLNSLKNLQPGKRIKSGEIFTEFGMRFENGNWPPHLHFQIILDMQGWEGDYPGVCKISEREQWLVNCPDPDLILNMNQYIR